MDNSVRKELKELQVPNTSWRPLDTLNVYPHHQTRFTLHVDHGDTDMAEFGAWLSKVEELDDIALDQKMSEEFVRTMRQYLSVHQLQCFMHAFADAYAEDETERQEAIRRSGS
jgi:hypothetical protein